MEVSVVVPVYNAEKFIYKCVDSLLNQTFTDYEIILVNDGSRDNSYEICLSLAKGNDSIHVVNKANGGASSARNAGIERAVGKYITFVDSDDFVEQDYLSELYLAAEAENADLTICGYRAESELGEWIDFSLEKRLFSQKEYADWVYREKAFFWGRFSPCIKLYKTGIIQKNKLRFDENAQLSEDMIFNIDYIMHLNSVAVIPYIGYNYVCNGNSLTHNVFGIDVLRSKVYAEIVFLDRVERLYKKLGLYDDNKLFLANKRTGGIFKTNEYIKQASLSRIERFQVKRELFDILTEESLDALSERGPLYRLLCIAAKCKSVFLLDAFLTLHKLVMRYRGKNL